MPEETLARLRVIELGEGVPGPFCGKLLAGLGAEVIKIEPPGTGEPGRRVAPFPSDTPHHEHSGLFLHLNTRKKSITLDWRSATGYRLLKRLVEDADVLVENLGPGRSPDYADLAEANPRLVMTAISYFGMDGPYSRYQGSEIVAYALGGYMMLTGEPDREPLKSYGYLAEYHGGLQGALGTLLALRTRERSGLGQLVDVSVMEAASLLMGGTPQFYHFRRRLIRRAGPRLMGVPPQSGYPSTIRPVKGGYVHVHTNYRQPELMAALMEEPRLADAEVLATPFGNADLIDELMAPWLESHDKWEVVRLAQAHRLPFTEVLTPDEVLLDSHHRERGFFFKLPHPGLGEVTHLGPPMRMTATPWQAGRAPLLGEHNTEIYCERLGLSHRELVMLRRAGVV